MLSIMFVADFNGRQQTGEILGNQTFQYVYKTDT